jgi:hypothetical protein
LFAALAAVAGGCASALNSSTTGFVDLEPSKPTDAKSAQLKDVGRTAASTREDSLTTPRENVAPITDAADRDRGLFTSDSPPAGSGFPPLLPRRTGANDGDLGALAAELRVAGVLSPTEQQALLDDLRQTDPALWPKLVHQFRLAVAYRSRGQGSAVGGLGDEASLVAASAESDRLGTQSVAYADGAPDSTATAAQANQVAAIGNTQANAHVSDAPTLSEPALRPPRKSADKKNDDKLAGSKSSDAAKSTNAVKVKESAADAKVSDSKTSGEAQLALTKAILAIEGDGSHPGNKSAAAELVRQEQLRMLYLASGRRDDALRPIEGLTSAQQEFWTKEIYGLATYFDAERSDGSGGSSDSESRAAEAALHLRDAAERLGELATPSVHNLAFCKEVTSFGVFKKFSKYEFKPGDEALLYCEMENLKTESTDKGFRTSVKARIEILDSRGERVAEQEFPASEDYCARPRRDFFIPYFVSIPKRISDGTYTLKLTVEDAQTQKTGQGSIQFSVK